MFRRLLSGKGSQLRTRTQKNNQSEPALQRKFVVGEGTARERSLSVRISNSPLVKPLIWSEKQTVNTTHAQREADVQALHNPPSMTFAPQASTEFADEPSQIPAWAILSPADYAYTCPTISIIHTDGETSLHELDTTPNLPAESNDYSQVALDDRQKYQPCPATAATFQHFAELRDRWAEEGVAVLEGRRFRQDRDVYVMWVNQEFEEWIIVRMRDLDVKDRPIAPINRVRRLIRAISTPFLRRTSHIPESAAGENVMEPPRVFMARRRPSQEGYRGSLSYKKSDHTVACSYLQVKVKASPVRKHNAQNATYKVRLKSHASSPGYEVHLKNTHAIRGNNTHPTETPVKKTELRPKALPEQV
ncbi:hypothetical protein B0H17DRAFT_1127671 [Mycena rosella]|uniref:Uncharacterized protein n=1 Tax=Mycena rosella TaxID=1033263 RepID=A0AAD7DYI5_MYCRO|nr:hypothetical protein B0H17DRAFT_1127671 [Mycena rosella]